MSSAVLEVTVLYRKRLYVVCLLVLRVLCLSFNILMAYCLLFSFFLRTKQNAPVQVHMYISCRDFMSDDHNIFIVSYFSAPALHLVITVFTVSNLGQEMMWPNSICDLV
jgi:hypothetical protein